MTRRIGLTILLFVFLAAAEVPFVWAQPRPPDIRPPDIQIIPTKKLQINVTGAGGVVIAITAGSFSLPGSACPPTCTLEVPTAVTLRLTAVPGPTSTFGGWSGSCSGTGACSVAMSSERTVGVTFNAFPNVTITITPRHSSATGGVASTNPPLACPTGTCTFPIPPGTALTLGAAAGPGAQFEGWTGACSGTGNCSLTMSTSRSVTALFDLPRLTVGVGQGTGLGKVTSTPTGIDCSSGSCSAKFSAGTQVTLSAAHGTGFFSSWSGCATASGTDCTVQMNADRSVQAVFDMATLTANKGGDGFNMHSVATSPAGISCGTGCNSATSGFPRGQAVTITAVPATGYFFGSWSGCTAASGDPLKCSITMSNTSQALRSVSANFSQPKVRINFLGTGTGTVSFPGTQLSPCDSSCTRPAQLNLGITVHGAATGTNNVFKGWAGTQGCPTTNADCTFTLGNEVKQISAQFEPVWSLTVQATRSGTQAAQAAGSVSGSVNCATTAAATTTTCAAVTFDAGTQITLNATPQTGTVFDGWTNVPTGASANCSDKAQRACSFPLRANSTVGATFKRP